MSSNADTKCCQEDCGNQDGISAKQFDRNTMCQACKDIVLFKQPPLNEDCPICFLPFPLLMKGSKYKACCGKIICGGCIHAVQMMDPDEKCPFCRVPAPKSREEIIEMAKKHVDMDDAEAIYGLGCCYNNGEMGLRQDRGKALELWNRAGELGSAKSYHNLGNAYYYGEGVERDAKKAKHYWELAAIGGNVSSRYNLGIIEEDAGNMNRALKHHMIAAGCGYDKSLKIIREFYMNGNATNDDYAKALGAHQKYVDSIKSDQRDEAAAFANDEYGYR